MTHDSAPAADTSHSHTDTSFAHTSHTSHDTWSSPPHHDTSHTNPSHSHHEHHGHHHHNHHRHDGNPLLDDQAPPSYGSIINERDGRRPAPRRRRQTEDITFIALFVYFVWGCFLIAFIWFSMLFVADGLPKPGNPYRGYS